MTIRLADSRNREASVERNNKFKIISILAFVRRVHFMIGNTKEVNKGKLNLLQEFHPIMTSEWTIRREKILFKITLIPYSKRKNHTANDACHHSLKKVIIIVQEISKEFRRR